MKHMALAIESSCLPEQNLGPETGRGSPAPRPEFVSRKAAGIHYTPPLLAAYLARHVAEGLMNWTSAPANLDILDPACGDGELLLAVAEAFPVNQRARLFLTGFDTDERALERAEKLLMRCGASSVDLRCADFLSIAPAPGSRPQLDLLLGGEAGDGVAHERSHDAVISNPPYVRTQVLGAVAARELAARFDLTGRVDLYHAFVKAMTHALRQEGILGLLTSNRFLTVQSGTSIRDWLSNHFHLVRLVDLGDTKLFEAAVLPAVLIARRGATISVQDCEFIRVYEAAERPSEPAREAASILEVLDGSFSGHARVKDLSFHVETGRLQTGADGATPWSMTNDGVRSWLDTVKKHSAGTFGDVVKICVGVKTTADSVFVRDNWDSLPEDERPEPELLHPLITHDLATRWGLPPGALAARSKRVLYPYSASGEDRTPIDLADHPGARAYLLKHRQRLESRRYLIESGRQWFEIWVPHRPGDWTGPKLAFPDISEENRFFMVEGGWIVNGDCYWTKLRPGKDTSWLFLLLAVANSSFALKFYDVMFHNKLYSGRRRFMSQYVSRFPLPEAGRTKDILGLMPRVMAASLAGAGSDLRQLDDEMDDLVWRAFGLRKEVAR
jgi:adenine-specific DNA-methyltransferase